MSDLSELRRKADEFKKKEDFKSAAEAYRELYALDKNEWNGYFFAQCLRKSDKFQEAREIQKEIRVKYPNFAPIKNEELWLDYSEKIKDWKNENILEDAELLLSKTNKHDKYTGSIYNKTVLNVVKHLIFNKENQTALEWLNKIDFNALSNKSFLYQGVRYPSDLKTYFIRYADNLIELGIHTSYIDKFLNSLGFEGKALSDFKEKIENEITFGDYVSRVKLALFLKLFKEELHIRKNKPRSTYNQSKISLISDISDFEFCPASFAINETYNIPLNVSWDNDEWLNEKKYLLHRYSEFQKSKNFLSAFSDTNIPIDDNLKNDFGVIFNSKLVSHNYDNGNKKFYSNPNNSLRGNPDYVFQNSNGKFVVVEKFTKRTSENISTAFSNDLSKVFGYLFELKDLNLSHGYLIYWYWFLEDVYDKNNNPRKKIVIKAYKIFHIEKSVANKDRFQLIYSKFLSFKTNKRFEVNGKDISYANKCLHCSVFSYCHHKTSKYDNIQLPYNIDTLKVGKEPDFQELIKKVDYDNEQSSGDLPF